MKPNQEKKGFDTQKTVGTILLVAAILSLLWVAIFYVWAFKIHMLLTALAYVLGLALIKRDYRPSRFFLWLIPYPMVYFFLFFYPFDTVSVFESVFTVGFFTAISGRLGLIGDLLRYDLGLPWTTAKVFDLTAPPAFATSLWCVILAFVSSRVEQLSKRNR